MLAGAPKPLTEISGFRRSQRSNYLSPAAIRYNKQPGDEGAEPIFQDKPVKLHMIADFEDPETSPDVSVSPAPARWPGSSIMPAKNEQSCSTLISPKKVKFTTTFTAKKKNGYCVKPGAKRLKLPEVTHRAHRAYQPLDQIDFSQQLLENRVILAGSCSTETFASNESSKPGVGLRKVIF